MQKSTEHILSLDLCRGFAAICVMFYHISFLFADTFYLFPRGYLSVDFFFILSGYVVSKSYDGKIASGLGFQSFFVRRIARLWPLLLLTTVLGFFVQYIRFRRDILDLSAWDLAVSFAANSFMFPSPKSPTEFLFPFNPAAWSIFFEMFANVVYALLFVYLSTKALVIVVLASAAGLVWTALTLNTLDVGMTQGNFILGFPRVLFSFFLGVLIYRNRDALWRWPTTSASPIFVGLLAVGVLVSIPKIPLQGVNGLLDLFVVFAVFPLLMRLAEKAQFSSRISWIAWFVGGVSYSIYLLQTPLMIGFSALPQMLWAKKIAVFQPWSGVLFTMLLLPVAYICWKYFELPAQRWLMKTFHKDEMQVPRNPVGQDRGDGQKAVLP